MTDAPKQISMVRDPLGGWGLSYPHERDGTETLYILATPSALSSHPEVMKLVAEAVAAERERLDDHRRAQDKRIRMQREELRWMHVICKGVNMAAASIASGYRKQRAEAAAIRAKDTP